MDSLNNRFNEERVYLKINQDGGGGKKKKSKDNKSWKQKYLEMKKENDKLKKELFELKGM